MRHPIGKRRMARTRESTLFETICAVIGILALILTFKIDDKEEMITLLSLFKSRCKVKEKYLNNKIYLLFFDNILVIIFGNVSLKNND